MSVVIISDRPSHRPGTRRSGRFDRGVAPEPAPPAAALGRGAPLGSSQRHGPVRRERRLPRRSSAAILVIRFPRTSGAEAVQTNDWLSGASTREAAFMCGKYASPRRTLPTCRLRPSWSLRARWPSPGGRHFVPAAAVEVEVVAIGLARSRIADVGVQRAPVVGELERAVSPLYRSGLARQSGACRGASGDRRPVSSAAPVALRRGRRVRSERVQGEAPAVRQHPRPAYRHDLQGSSPSARGPWCWSARGCESNSEQRGRRDPQGCGGHLGCPGERV